MVVATAPASAAETPRGRLRQWFEARIDGVDEFEISEIEREAEEEFLRDAEWTKAMFGRLLGQELRALLSQMRGRLTLGDTVVTGGAKAKGMKARADALARKWGSWVEHTGTGHVRLMAMTKPQLLEAAAEREARGQIEIRTAKLWRALAAQLSDDGQRVKDHFRPEQIEALEYDILTEG